MGTKTISISDDAYKRLANLRRENESFSVIIKRITNKRKLDDFYGVLSKASSDRFEKAIKQSRKESRKLHSLRNKRLQRAFN